MADDDRATRGYRLWLRDAAGWTTRLTFPSEPLTWGEVLDKIEMMAPPGQYAFITVRGEPVNAVDVIDIPADTVPVFGYYRKQTMVKPARSARAQFEDARATELSKALGMLGGAWEINEDIVHRAYVYLRQPGRQPTNDEERVAATAFEVFDEIGALGNQAEEDDDGTVDDIEALIRANRNVLRREWKFHLQPTKADLGKLVRAVTASRLIGERCGIIKVLYDDRLLRNKDTEEGNFARVVVYFYGTKPQANDVLDELVRVTAGVSAIATAPRYSARATPLVYWTQSSGDIKNNYAVLLAWYDRQPAADIFEPDYTSFRGRANRLDTPAAAAQLPTASVRLTRGERAELAERLQFLRMDASVSFQKDDEAAWSFRFLAITDDGVEAVGEADAATNDVEGVRITLLPTESGEVFVNRDAPFSGDYLLVKDIGADNADPFGTAVQIADARSSIEEQRDAIMSLAPGEQLNWGPFMFKFYDFKVLEHLDARETYLRYMSTRDVCEGIDPRTGEYYNILPAYYRNSLTAAEYMLTVTRVNEFTGNEQYEAFLMADRAPDNALHFSLLCGRRVVQVAGREVRTAFGMMLQCMMASFAFASGFDFVTLEALEFNKEYYKRFGYDAAVIDPATGQAVADASGNITFVLRRSAMGGVRGLCDSATARVGNFLQEYAAARGSGAQGKFTDEEIADRLREVGGTRAQAARALLASAEMLM